MCLGLMGEAAQPLLARAAAVLAEARNAGLPIIYIRGAFRPGYPEVSAQSSRTFIMVRDMGRMIEGTPGAAIHAQVAPRPEDVVVTKRRVGAFGTTDLPTVLRARDVTTLILLGVSTSGVVLSTVRSAADEDYTLVVVEDCCLDPDEEVHRVLTQKVFPRQAQVVSAEEVRDALADATGGATA